MKLDKHIATSLLTDDMFVREVVVTSTGAYADSNGVFDRAGARETYSMLNPTNQKAYYITETVLDKLDLLKVKRSAIMHIRKQNSEELIAEVPTYDWSIFYKLKHGKTTFILPENRVVRMVVSENIIWLCMLKNDGIQITWTFFYMDKVRNTLSQNWPEEELQGMEELIYKMLCFFYLSENEEILIEAGQRYGTRKSGKVINTLPVPVTIVNSKWNVTTIRTEGFPVSGHFRLQPTKTGLRMIMIEPYMKHGYIRHAKKDTEI